MLGRNQQQSAGQGRIMPKHVRIATLGVLAACVMLGAWFYVPHHGCARQQTEIYLQGYYELVPGRAAQSAAVHCLLHANRVDYSGRGGL